MIDEILLYYNSFRLLIRLDVIASVIDWPYLEVRVLKFILGSD